MRTETYYRDHWLEVDLNCLFPIDRLRELDSEGVIGDVAPRLWSDFMGRIYKRRAVIEEHAPALAHELANDEVDLFLLGRDLTAQVRPPRSVFVNFPMGNPFGRPHDADTQRAILLEALRLAERCDEAGLLVDLPHDWGEPFGTIVASPAETT